MAQTSAQALQTSLGKLQISTNSKPTAVKKTAPADSWEDEADASSSDTETEDTPPASATINPSTSYDAPAPPPPTPSSPSFAPSYASTNSPYQTFPPYGFDGANDEDSYSLYKASRKNASACEEKRPEKSTAVASRLIAAGIGQKAPRRTKEQREYDQAMKVQEKKKRDAAKAEEDRKKAEKEKAIKDVWGD